MHKVVLAGKSNVGKSSLFNLLARGKRAIVSSKENTTRDIHPTLVRGKGGDWILVDTGGISRTGEPLTQIIEKKLLREMEDADLVLAVFDIHNVNTEDRELCSFLRKSQIPLLLAAANKADREKDDGLISDIYALGFHQVIPLSCLGGRNIGLLKETVSQLLTELDPRDKTMPYLPLAYDFTTALVGKPNVGKSSLFNLLAGHQRSLVWEESGTTRDKIIDYMRIGRTGIRLIDTAGMRRRNRPKEEVEEYSVHQALGAISQGDVCLLMIDVREGITAQDKKLAAVIQRKQKSLAIVANKWDLIEDLSWGAYERSLRDSFPHIGHVPVFPISCRDGKNIDFLKKQVLKLFRSRDSRLPTSELNRILREAIRNHPPVEGPKPLRLYYAIQGRDDPPEIHIFINKLARLYRSYRQYLENAFVRGKKIKGHSLRLKFIEKI